MMRRQRRNFSRRESNDILLDASWKSLDDHRKRFKDIDNKALWIITITGILATLLDRPIGDIYNYATKLYIFTLISFLVTILLCIGVLMIRTYEALSTRDLMDELLDEERQAERIISTIAETEKTILEANNEKLIYLKCSFIALIPSVLLLIIYSIMR